MTPADAILAILFLSMACAWWQERLENRRKIAQLQLRIKGHFDWLNAVNDSLDLHTRQIKAMQEVDTKLVDSYLENKVEQGKTRMLVRRGLEEMSK